MVNRMLSGGVTKVLWRVVTQDGKKHDGKFLVGPNSNFESELFRRADLHARPTAIGMMLLFPDGSIHIRHYIKRGDQWVRVWTTSKDAPTHMFWWITAVIAFFIMLACFLVMRKFKL